MQAAAEELLSLPGVDGLQLTPGNAPTEGFLESLARQGVPTRTHHGFDARALRSRVWSDTARCMVRSDSVHPPRDVDAASAHWRKRAEAGDYAHLTLETMYPGHALGTGDALQWAMDLGLRLAVDVSHLHIQRTAGRLSDAVLHRLWDHPHIDEVHVSANPGDRDAHEPLTADTFGLGWARERMRSGLPVIFECYLHRLTPDERREQLALLRGPS
ncbi:hypothetical protein LXT21_40695 [Myxococcus sp. K38C18041901]|uniref:hypothetical protein n=1 Tax=Myxococcus guangdongensis TaxID=2906760 RepID=UPI0020A7C73D|nr:hypothetical protein [Myxococcus guangdongensis]MCP3065110.1 hypothetical protein [Myxococcus guangdongensis]